MDEVCKQLPTSILESLHALALRAHIKAESSEQELLQFKKEIEIWFDRSMDRASGVYKRNAKGVSFVIGFLIAFGCNADTLHLYARLSNDPSLRDAINQKADALIVSCPQNSSQPDFSCIRNKLNQAVSLPLGWDEANINQQQEESQGWLLPFSKRLMGWIVTGFAIAMGAPFWFDLLGKLVNVRNTGKRPESTIEQSAAGKPKES